MISIGESKQKKWRLFSKLTEWVEGVGHSHIFISWKDGLGLRWVAEARGSGVRLVSNVEFKRDNEVVKVYHYICSQENHDACVKYVWQETNKSYGFLQLLGLFYMRVANYITRSFGGINRHNNPFRDGNHSQICCEFGLNVAHIALGEESSPYHLENFGLIETRQFNKMYGKQQPQDLIDRINGVF